MDDLADVSVRELPQRFALQLNDTHPSVGVAELVRLLVDKREPDWAKVREITVATFGSTNHTCYPAWQDTESWTKMSLLNTARSGKFSSDRAITEYCDDIWKVWPLTVKI